MARRIRRAIVRSSLRSVDDQQTTVAFRAVIFDADKETAAPGRDEIAIHLVGPTDIEADRIAVFIRHPHIKVGPAITQYREFCMRIAVKRDLTHICLTHRQMRQGG